MNSLSLPYPIIITLIIVAAIGTIATIIKILKSEDSSKKLRPKEIQSDENEVKSKEESKSGLLTKKPQASYRKIWNWIILIAIISAIIGAFLIVPKYYDKGGNRIGIAKSALYSWKKKGHQYGYNPAQRFGGPYNALITRDDVSDFHFTVFSPNGKNIGYFTGRKEDGGIIKGSGWWQTDPKDGRDGRDGGEWHLKMDPNDPRLYEGECTDSDLPDGVNVKLRIID